MGQKVCLAPSTGMVMLFLILAGCRSEMYDQPRFEPYEATEFFDDGTSARPLVAGTVPRRDPREQGKSSDEHFTTGKKTGQLAETLPFPVDMPCSNAVRIDSGYFAHRVTANWGTAEA